MRSSQQRLVMLGSCILAVFLISDMHWRAPLSDERQRQRQQLQRFLAQAQDDAYIGQPLIMAQEPLLIPQQPIVIETWQLEADQGQLQLLGPAEYILGWLHALQTTPWMFSALALEANHQGLRLSGSLHRQQQRIGSAAVVVPAHWRQLVQPIKPTKSAPAVESTPLISCAPDFSWEHEVIAFTPGAGPQAARIATRGHPALMPISYYLPTLSSTQDVQVHVSTAGEFRLFAPDRDCIPVEFPLLPTRSSPVFWLP
ncbi:hypothetical protein FM042_08955 [Aliidiomarina halalkaliphila]|uniref:Uncharacterized protein n=1 Tax=Aliidiomarina halalkaliphila TaxID=2593535 RepID=A0A552WZQ7_9GAMM|nr:hypothetical protein [Aliidiomarina halalkaliphila]TRW48302.1 hypothetical protein FM042_08955 [Aliidiomarina halalkaliphila]